MPNREEKGYAGFGKSETVVSRYFFFLFFLNIGVLENFANFTGKCPCWSLFFNKVAGLQLYYKRFQQKCFPVRSIKF